MQTKTLHLIALTIQQVAFVFKYIGYFIISGFNSIFYKCTLQVLCLSITCFTYVICIVLQKLKHDHYFQMI